MLKTSVIIEDLDDPRKFELTLKQIRDAGFDAVDPALFTPGIIRIIEGPGAAEYAGLLRRMVEDSGLYICQCHTAYDRNNESDPPVRRGNRRHVSRCPPDLSADRERPADPGGKG